MNEPMMKMANSVVRIKVIFDDDIRGVKEYCMLVHTALLSKISDCCNKLLEKDSNYENRINSNVMGYGFNPKKHGYAFCTNVIKYICFPPFKETINEFPEAGNEVCNSTNPAHCNLTYNQIWDIIENESKELIDNTIDNIILKLLSLELVLLSEHESTLDESNEEDQIRHIGFIEICDFKIYLDSF